jgi:hypothetical protein
VDNGMGKWEEKLHGLGVRTTWDSSNTLYIREMKKPCFQETNFVYVSSPLRSSSKQWRTSHFITVINQS